MKTIEKYREFYLVGRTEFPIDCPELVNEYFEKAKEEYLEHQKKILGVLYNEEKQINGFITLEIQKRLDLIKSLGIYRSFLNKRDLDCISIWQAYIDFLVEYTPKSIPASDITSNQLALKLVYEGKNVTRTNASSHLIGELKSADYLYNTFTKWTKRQNRIANPDGTRLVLDNKIKLFESVVEILSPDLRQKAIDELNILKSY